MSSKRSTRLRPGRAPPWRALNVQRGSCHQRPPLSIHPPAYGHRLGHARVVQERRAKWLLAAEHSVNLPPQGVVRRHPQRLPSQLSENPFNSFLHGQKPEFPKFDCFSRDQLRRQPEHLRPVQVLREQNPHHQLFIAQAELVRQRDRVVAARDDSRAPRVSSVDQPVLEDLSTSARRSEQPAELHSERRNMDGAPEARCQRTFSNSHCPGYRRQFATAKSRSPSAGILITRMSKSGTALPRSNQRSDVRGQGFLIPKGLQG